MLKIVYDVLYPKVGRINCKTRNYKQEILNFTKYKFPATSKFNKDQKIYLRSLLYSDLRKVYLLLIRPSTYITKDKETLVNQILSFLHDPVSFDPSEVEVGHRPVSAVKTIDHNDDFKSNTLNKDINKELKKINEKLDQLILKNVRSEPDECKYKVIKLQTAECKFCKTELNVDINHIHEQQCAYQPIICEWCGISIPLIEFYKHTCSSKNKAYYSETFIRTEEETEVVSGLTYTISEHKSKIFHQGTSDQRSQVMSTKSSGTFATDQRSQVMSTKSSGTFATALEVVNISRPESSKLMKETKLLKMERMNENRDYGSEELNPERMLEENCIFCWKRSHSSKTCPIYLKYKEK